MSDIKCMNPWDSQAIRQYGIDGVYPSLQSNCNGGQNRAGICYAIDQQGGKSNCGYAREVMMTLCSDSHGTPHAVCYAIEGNIVDRVSSKNGKGWCENVSPTLNTQDRHAVAYGVVSKGNGEAFITKERHMSLSIGGGQAGQGYPAVLYENYEDIHN